MSTDMVRDRSMLTAVAERMRWRTFRVKRMLVMPAFNAVSCADTAGAVTAGRTRNIWFLCPNFEVRHQ